MSPDADRFDDRTKLRSRRCETILVDDWFALGSDAHYDPGSFQLFQPLGQKGWRHARDPPPQFVEAARSHHEFAQHEQRPAGADDLGSHGNRAELIVTAIRHFVCLPGDPFRKPAGYELSQVIASSE